MAANDPQVNFRLPANLRDRLKGSADENNRTLTAEIVARLEESFAMPGARSSLGMRMRLGAYREFMTTTVDMLQRQADALRDYKQHGRMQYMTDTYPLREGEDADEALGKVVPALETFKAQLAAVTRLLTEIAIAEATLKPLTEDQIQDRIRLYSINTSML